MVPQRKSLSVLDFSVFVLSPLWVCLRIFPLISSLYLASLFPVFSWTPLCPGYFALFCLLLMCSNNVCRQASLLSSPPYLFHSLSVLFSYPHSLNLQPRYPHVRLKRSLSHPLLHTPFFHYAFVITLSPYPSFAISLVRHLPLYYLC